VNASEHKAFVVFLVLVTIAFFWLLLPFYGAVFWAVILAIVFHPLQRALEQRFGPRSNRAAILSVLICIIIAVIPVAVILGSMLSEGAKLLTRIQAGEFDTSALINNLQARMPTWATEFLGRTGIGDLDAIRERAINVAQQLGQIVAAQALNLGSNTLRFVASVGIMVYVLFFLFRDGRRVIVPAIRACMPLSERHTRELGAKFAAVVRATVKGNIVIAAIQGTIGGVTLWFLGVDGAILWGALMIFLSLLPAVGAAIIWLPISIYFFLSGDLWRGAILVAVGAGVIGLVDNLLRPTLVGKDTRLPDYVILVSTVGGISIFGINGFVIGPLIAALFVAFWSLYRDEREPEVEPPLILPIETERPSSTGPRAAS
jgi:predicted PurR-regulated permease PerM